MKNLIQIATVLFLLVQTSGYSQTKNANTIPKKQETTLKRQIEKAEISTVNLKSFIGIYFLEEADFTLEIIQEDDKMYIVSPFSKDILILKNETTVHEPTRGIDLELIEDDKDALKYTQNGYETVIKKVKSETKN